MKTVERVTLAIFSCLILIISILMLFIIFRWIDITLITSAFEYILNTPVVSNILLALSVIFILLSIKCIFFDTSSKDRDGMRDGIMLENDSGKLLISKDTIENLTNSVVKGFDSAENIVSKVILDKENNVKIDVTLFVHPEAVIKDLSINLQNRIKDAIKKSLDLDVKEINIKIKNITANKVNSQE